MSATFPDLQRAIRRRRRVGPALVCALLAVLLSAAHVIWGETLAHPSTLSGWSLLAAFGALIALSVRKALPGVRGLRSVAAWKATHLAVGALAVLLFALHAPRWPTGPLELALAATFATVTLTGVLGVFVGYALPRRLARRGESVLFERIPGEIARLREGLEARVFAEASTEPAALYAEVLRPYFHRPCHFWAHLRDDRHVLDELHVQLAPLGTELRAFVGESLQRKADLDYHHAHLRVLRGWLLVHVPLAYGLVTLSGLHVLLVHAFGATP